MLVFLVVIHFPTVALLADCAEATLRFETVAERLVQAINKRDDKAVRQDFAKGMKEALPEEKAKAFLDGLLDQLGKFLGILASRFGCERSEAALGQLLFPFGLFEGLLLSLQIFRLCLTKVPLPLCLTQTLMEFGDGIELRNRREIRRHGFE